MAFCSTWPRAATPSEVSRRRCVETELVFALRQLMKISGDMFAVILVSFSHDNNVSSHMLVERTFELEDSADMVCRIFIIVQLKKVV